MPDKHTTKTSMYNVLPNSPKEGQHLMVSTLWSQRPTSHSRLQFYEPTHFTACRAR